MELLPTLPREADYTALADHQSHTPASFYGGPAVLHAVSRGGTLTARPADLRAIAALATWADAPSADADADADVHLPGIDVWVASDKLVLARARAARALAIPYRRIALHAVSAAGVYLQLSTDDDDTVDLTLTPAASNGGGGGGGEERPVDTLFQALSDCADLHPDPQDDDDDDMPSVIRDAADSNANGLYQITGPPAAEGLPPPLPGSTGWITADNLHDFFDADGNWTGAGAAPGLLGPGAGTVRDRDAEDGEGDEDEQQGDDDDTKWQRTG